MPCTVAAVFGDDVFEVIEDRFRFCVKRSARLERLADGCRWTEGPAYFAAGRYLVWSDIPNDRMLRWDEPTGNVGVFRAPAGYTNGNTVDRQGRLVSCEHGAGASPAPSTTARSPSSPTATRASASTAPTTWSCKSDGSIWFTDPAYGIDSDYEGHRADSEIGACHVYRVDADGRDCRIVADDFVRPNGLAFSPDERRLYISDTGRPTSRRAAPHPRVRRRRRRRRCPAATCSPSAPTASSTASALDDRRPDLDERGRRRCDCYEPDGTLLGRILVPEVVANVVFGGPKRNRLFICATTSLYSVLLPVNGLG